MPLEQWGLIDAGRFLWNLMLALAFFIGIFLIVSREAVECLNRDCQREFGWRKYVLYELEGRRFGFIDAFVLKYPIWVGLVISVTAFILLLVNRPV